LHQSYVGELTLRRGEETDPAFVGGGLVPVDRSMGRRGAAGENEALPSSSLRVMKRVERPEDTQIRGGEHAGHYRDEGRAPMRSRPRAVRGSRAIYSSESHSEPGG